MSQPDRVIETEFSLAELVNCDRSRIGQLASNLIGNALMYGKAGAPVRVQAAIRDGAFTLSVSNSGEPISPVALKRLFLPFSRGDVEPNQQGLGLGLYIASEIARAHGGTIEVTSTAEETRFTFRMPAKYGRAVIAHLRPIRLVLRLAALARPLGLFLLALRFGQSLVLVVRVLGHGLEAAHQHQNQQDDDDEAQARRRRNIPVP